MAAPAWRSLPRALGLAALLTLFAPRERLAAAEIAVTSTADDGEGSLRAAVAEASKGDTVRFALTLPATISLTSGALVIAGDLTLAGPGAGRLELSAGRRSRVIVVEAGHTVNLLGLTIRDGEAPLDGGGIHNSGTLRLTNCVVAWNTAGGGENAWDGTGGKGGGIYNGAGGFLTATGCTFRTNTGGGGRSGSDPFAPAAGGTGGPGGAIFNGGTVSLNSCTFYDNRSGSGGRGGSNLAGWGYNGGKAGDGGAVYNAGNFGCVSCTVSGNFAGAGGNGGSSSSILGPGGPAGNGGRGGGGGGIFNGATASSVFVGNTLTAGNRAGSGGNGGGGPNPGAPGPAGTGADLNGPFTSLGYNLTGTADGSSGLINNTGGNLSGSDALPVRPGLGGLQDNGGPTPTMALLPGSPAINRGDPSAPDTDQRGFPRPGSLGYDIGAFEGFGYAGESLLVADYGQNDASRFQLRPTADLGRLVWPSIGTSYRILGPRGVLYVDNNLLVGHINLGMTTGAEILVFNADTGDFISKWVSSTNPSAPWTPGGIIMGPNRVLHVADFGDFSGKPPRIARYVYNQFMGNVNTAGLTGPFRPAGLVIGPDGLLYVTSFGAQSGSLEGYVLRFRFNTVSQNYDYLDTFVTCTAADNYALHLHTPRGIVFGPDGNLYVSSIEASFVTGTGETVIHRDAIVVFNRQGQHARPPIYLNEPSGLRVYARGLIFGPRGDLFVPTTGGRVRRYSAASNYTEFQFLTEPGRGPVDPWFAVFRGTNPSTLAYEAPSLNLTRNGPSLNLAWPARAVGWQLQSQYGGLHAAWTSVPESILTDRITVPLLPEQPAGFFRLEAP